MKRKTIINITFILSALMMISGVFLQITAEREDALYWGGMLLFAVAELMRQQDKAKEKQTERQEEKEG